MFTFGTLVVYGVNIICADPESFVRGGPTLTTFIVILFFLVDEGRDDPKTLKTGHHRPTSECWLDSFVISMGSGSVLIRNPLAL